MLQRTRSRSYAPNALSGAEHDVIERTEPTVTHRMTAAETPVPTLESVDLVLDTNVMLEMASAELWRHADDLPTVEAIRGSPSFRSRQLRAKYSLAIAWVCAERELVTLSLQDEVTALLQRNVPSASRKPPTVLTKVIGHLVLDRVLGRWQAMAWRDDEFQIEGTEADKFLLKIAAHYGAPLITNEGLSPGGVHDGKRGRNLRGRGRDGGANVLSPREYLDREGIDVPQAARSFYDAYVRLGNSVFRGETQSDLHGPGLRDALALLRSFYAFVLLDEVDPAGGEINPPTIPWDAG